MFESKKKPFFLFWSVREKEHSKDSNDIDTMSTRESRNAHTLEMEIVSHTLQTML